MTRTSHTEDTQERIEKDLEIRSLFDQGRVERDALAESAVKKGRLTGRSSSTSLIYQVLLLFL